jgi:GTP-binding protein
MALEASDDDARFLEEGRLLFAGQADFMLGVVALTGLPTEAGVEIAFAGRSNVGKSSLVNGLTGRKALARTSNTPGRTQELNFFRIADRFTLVDMPGYGYAAAPEDKVKTWTRLIKSYLAGRSALARVYVLIDSRHGLKPVDTGILDMLDVAGVSYQIVLTKADAMKADEREARIAGVLAGLAKRPAAFPVVLPTSSRTGEGMPELRAAVARLLSERE